MTTQPKRNYIKILMEYLVWVDGLTFAIDMCDKKKKMPVTMWKYSVMKNDLGKYLESLDTQNQMKLMQLAMEYKEDRDKVIQRSHWYYERNLQKKEESNG